MLASRDQHPPRLDPARLVEATDTFLRHGPTARPGLVPDGDAAAETPAADTQPIVTYLARVPEEAADLTPFWEIVTEAEAAKARRYRIPSRGRLAVSARAFARLVLARWLGIPAREIVLTATNQGKPVLPETAGLFFNVSHAEDWIAVTVTRSGPIGVDLEWIDPRRDHAGLARRYFAEPERHWLATVPDEAGRREAFFRIWTGKEAFVKAVGTGLSLPLDAFDVSGTIRSGDAKHSARRDPEDQHSESRNTTYQDGENHDGATVRVLAARGVGAVRLLHPDRLESTVTRRVWSMAGLPLPTGWAGCLCWADAVQTSGGIEDGPVRRPRLIWGETLPGDERERQPADGPPDVGRGGIGPP